MTQDTPKRNMGILFHYPRAEFREMAFISPVAGRTLWIGIPIAYVVIGRVLHPKFPAHLRLST